ncbi:MAG: DUF4214 domain-containing protein [Bdellovibrionales bacterium]|nr:DUF4214 domain-containing protein [Bdellovibrionales bacterium]
MKYTRLVSVIFGTSVFGIALVNCTNGFRSSAQASLASQPTVGTYQVMAVSGTGSVMPAQASTELNSTVSAQLDSSRVRCSALSTVAGGGKNAAAVLQKCLDQNVGKTLLIPPGVYRLDRRVSIRGPIAVMSDTTTNAGEFIQCGIDDSRCARFVANNENDFSQVGEARRGAFHIEGNHVILESLILDGNRQNRRNLAAMKACRAPNPNNAAGMLLTSEANDLVVRGSVFKNAVCGTAFVTQGAQPRDMVLESNIFHKNGDHTDTWADGLTIGDGTNLKFVNNLFDDNTDVQLVLGGCQNCVISGNVFRHTPNSLENASFSELHLHNWPGGTSGDFTGTSVVNNNIDCQYMCAMALGLGGDSWYPSPQSAVFGAKITNNTITKAIIAINADVLTGSTLLENNTLIEAATGTAGTCNGQPIRMAAINITDGSKNYLVASSSSWLKRVVDNAPDSALITNRNYPYCLPDVAKASITRTYNLTSVTGDQAALFTDIVKQAYNEIFGRAPDSAGLQFHLNSLKNGQSETDMRRSMAISTEAQAAIRNIYQVVLGRDTDKVGLAAATESLAAGETTLAQLRRNMSASSEAANLITAAFQSRLSRAPTATELQSYQQKLASSHSLAQVRSEIANLPIPVPVDPLTEFITHLYRSALMREPDASGLAHWTDLYKSGKAGCRDLTQSLLTATEGSTRRNAITGNLAAKKAYIEMVYQVVLWRGSDSSGLNYWSSMLDSGALTVDQFENDLLNSPEFKEICAKRGLRY